MLFPWLTLSVLSGLCLEVVLPEGTFLTALSTITLTTLHHTLLLSPCFVLHHGTYYLLNCVHPCTCVIVPLLPLGYKLPKGRAFYFVHCCRPSNYCHPDTQWVLGKYQIKINKYA